MPEILITPAAESDLIGLWTYIAQDNRQAADAVFDAAQETFRLLLASPRIGTSFHAKRPSLKGIRSFPIKNYPTYIAYYRPTQNGIEIIRVLHGRMQREKRLSAGN